MMIWHNLLVFLLIKTSLGTKYSQPQKLVSHKTGDFMGMSNWFRLKSYIKQNHKVRRVPYKKPYSIWIENKQVSFKSYRISIQNGK